MVRAPCCEVGLKKGRWTDVEDDILTEYIQANGEGSWRSVPKNAGLLRCGKSCRLRWINYLRPDLKRGNFSGEEEDMITRLHASVGNRWSLIARHLHGRTDNEIKNYWNSHLSRNKLTDDLTFPNNKAEVTAKWKPRRSRSSQRASSKNVRVSAHEKDMNQHLDSIVVEKGMHSTDANEESFQILEYIKEEGEDSDVLFSIDDALSVKIEETGVDASMHNSNMSSVNQETRIKLSNMDVDTVSATDKAWADWNWKSIVTEEDEMLLMLLDDGSDLQ